MSCIAAGFWFGLGRELARACIGLVIASPFIGYFAWLMRRNR